MVVPALETLPIPVGAVIADKYRVDRFLGAGGMGVVALGRHLGLDQKIAIKMLHPQMAFDPDTVARFVREARAVTRIQSEHVAKVIDVGMVDDRIPFIVMEYLEGTDLAKQVRDRGKLEVGESVEYVLQACEALAEAHRNGVVHRDIKPANLFVARRADGSPLVKVLDFGVSKLQSSKNLAVSEELTRSNAVIGSPHYMSPEQLRSAKDVDGRTDIWALGAVFYKLLTGKPAFGGSTSAELHAAVLMQPAPRLSVERPDVPPELDAVVAKCLEKDVSKRFASVAELAEALAPIASEDARSSIRTILRVTNAPKIEKASSIPPPPHSGVPSFRLSPGSSPSISASPKPALAVGDDGSVSVHMTLSASSGSASRESPSRMIWIALGCGILVVAALVIVGLSRQHSESSPVVSDRPRASAETPSPPAASLSASTASSTTVGAQQPAPSASNEKLAAPAHATAPKHATAPHAHASSEATAATSAAAPTATAKPATSDGTSEFGGRT